MHVWKNIWVTELCIHLPLAEKGYHEVLSTQFTPLAYRCADPSPKCIFVAVKISCQTSEHQLPLIYESCLLAMTLLTTDRPAFDSFSYPQRAKFGSIIGWGIS